MRVNIGDEYRHKNHVGEITDSFRGIGKNNEWAVVIVVHLPTMPEGQQWLTTWGPETDFNEEFTQ